MSGTVDGYQSGDQCHGGGAIVMRETPWQDIQRDCGHPVKPEWASLPYAIFDHLVAGHEDAQVYCQTCGRWQWPEAVQARLREAVRKGIVTRVKR